MAEVEGLLREAGFEEIRVETVASSREAIGRMGSRRRGGGPRPLGGHPRRKTAFGVQPGIFRPGGPETGTGCGVIFFRKACATNCSRPAGVRAGLSAVDIGAGSGFLTESLLKAGLLVTALDQSAGMLKEMEGKFGLSPALMLKQTTGDRLPLDDGAMDAALANMYLHHVDDPGQAIREMARVVKPGGVVVLSDLDEHNHEFLLKEHHDRWPGFQEGGCGRMVPGGRPGGGFRFASRAELLRRFPSGVGFGRHQHLYRPGEKTRSNGESG